MRFIRNRVLRMTEWMFQFACLIKQTIKSLLPEQIMRCILPSKAKFRKSKEIFIPSEVCLEKKTWFSLKKKFLYKKILLSFSLRTDFPIRWVEQKTENFL